MLSVIVILMDFLYFVSYYYKYSLPRLSLNQELIF